MTAAVVLITAAACQNRNDEPVPGRGSDAKYVGQAVGTFSEIIIADGSQLRRKISGWDSTIRPFKRKIT